MKHEQEKFGYKNEPEKYVPEAAPEAQASKEVKPSVDVKPYKPFEAKHKEQEKKAA